MESFLMIVTVLMSFSVASQSNPFLTPWNKLSANLGEPGLCFLLTCLEPPKLRAYSLEEWLNA